MCTAVSGTGGGVRLGLFAGGLFAGFVDGIFDGLFGDVLLALRDGLLDALRAVTQVRVDVLLVALQNRENNCSQQHTMHDTRHDRWAVS